MRQDRSTTVEIILYYLTKRQRWHKYQRSTTVEIILYYLTIKVVDLPIQIYNSRNYSILLNLHLPYQAPKIYNSRNYSILLNSKFVYLHNFFWSQATLFLLFYITFAQYMLSNIDYYKIKVQVCITL